MIDINLNNDKKCIATEDKWHDNNIETKVILLVRYGWFSSLYEAAIEKEKLVCLYICGKLALR